MHICVDSSHASDQGETPKYLGTARFTSGMCCDLQAVFAEVYELDVDEDVNKVLFALPQPMQAQAQAPKVVGHIKRDKKGRPAKGGQLEKEVCADGSAGAVKLLTPRLNSSIQGISRHHLSEVEAMLPNLLLIK